MIDVAQVASAHEAMEEEYDSIEDLWYPHLFNEIHRFMLAHLPHDPGARALDVGCGTGFQGLFVARAGYAVRGFDVAGRLVESARRKVDGPRESDELPWPGYRTTLRTFADDQAELVVMADKIRGEAPYFAPVFELGDATDPASYRSPGYSVITCCGSVLSFIDDHEQVLAHMAEALRPGGLLFLEVEQRVNLDLIWPVVDLLMGCTLEYEQSLGESLGNLFAKPGRSLRVNYPFPLANGSEVTLPIWLFSVGHLQRVFSRLGLEIVDRAGIHAVTNVVPSTLLHRTSPPRSRVRFVERLARRERTLARRWPFWRLGCSAIFALRRKQ